jgi:hypothetical protein
MSVQNIVRRQPWPLLLSVVILTGLTVAGCSTNKSRKNQQTSWRRGAQTKPPHGNGLRFTRRSPYRGYLEAHNRLANPLEVLGGPTTVTIAQTNGDVHVALPDYRKLDPDVFGTVAMPRAYGGTPIAEGVPLKMRETSGNRFTQLNRKTPFGQANVIMTQGTLKVTLKDVTATDAARSGDSVQFDATWQDPAGNVYEVRCDKVYPHGRLNGHPTFGGVLLNHLMHGSSRVGTPLMPTLFCYGAFWGPGEVLKNGKVLDRGRLVHGMLTEGVRDDNYALDFDKQVDPTNLMFHLIVPPMRNGRPDPVNTGFNLPNGKELPFWHVIFTNFVVQAKHLQMVSNFPEPSQPAGR